MIVIFHDNNISKGGEWDGCIHLSRQLGHPESFVYGLATV